MPYDASNLTLPMPVLRYLQRDIKPDQGSTPSSPQIKNVESKPRARDLFPLPNPQNQKLGSRLMGVWAFLEHERVKRCTDLWRSGFSWVQ